MSDNKIIHVTPELAIEWLGHNYEKNRNIRNTYVDQLADVMKTGRFIANNGQTIVFGNDGVLYDGQHRLSAIVKSGCAQDLLVVWVDDGERAYATIDNGTRRQASDFLDGLKDRTACAAYGKVMACVEWGHAPLLSCLQGKFGPHSLIDRGLIVTYCQENASSVQDAVRSARLMRDELGCGPQSTYSAFIGVVRYCEKDDFLDEFIDDLTSIVPDSKTVTAVKTMIMKCNNKANGLSTKWLFGTLLNAYSHYCDKDDCTMLNKPTQCINQYSGYVDTRRSVQTRMEMR